MIFAQIISNKIILHVVDYKYVIELIQMACCSEKKVECVIGGCHVYKAIWAAVVREELMCTKETANAANSNQPRNHHWTLTKKHL